MLQPASVSSFCASQWFSSCERRPPPQAAGLLRPGVRGDAVLWLRDTLARIRGDVPDADPSPVYDPPLETQVASQAVEPKDQHGANLSSPRGPQELIERRPAVLSPGDAAVDELGGEPVEQLRVRGRGALRAEVLAGLVVAGEGREPRLRDEVEEPRRSASSCLPRSRNC